MDPVIIYELSLIAAIVIAAIADYLINKLDNRKHSAKQ